MQYKNTKMHVQREGFSRQGIVQVVRTNVSRMRACRTFLWHSTCSFSLNSTFLRHTFVAFLNPTFQQRVLYSRGLDEQEQRGGEGERHWRKESQLLRDGLNIMYQVMTFSNQGNKTPYCPRGGRYYRKKLSTADISEFFKLSANYRYRILGIWELSKNYRYRKLHPILSDKHN